MTPPLTDRDTRWLRNIAEAPAAFPMIFAMAPARFQKLMRRGLVVVDGDGDAMRLTEAGRETVKSLTSVIADQ